MKTRRSFLGGLALAPVIPLTFSNRATAKSASSSDQQEVEDLLFAYASALDEGRIADCTALFARSEFTIKGVATVHGSDGLAELFSGIIIYEDGTPRTKHIVTNVNVDIAEDGSLARANSYLTVMQRFEDKSLRAIFSGSYDDQFKKDSNGWYFTERIITGALIGDMSQHLKKPPQ